MFLHVKAMPLILPLLLVLIGVGVLLIVEWVRRHEKAEDWLFLLGGAALVMAILLRAAA